MNPSHKYDTIKIMLLAALVILIGYFVYMNIANQRLSQQGKLYCWNNVVTCTGHAGNVSFSGTQVQTLCEDGSTSYTQCVPRAAAPGAGTLKNN